MAEMKMSELMDEFTCVICLNFYSIPIIECENKHPICCECFEKLSTCPLCRGAYAEPPTRSTTLERKLSNLKLPCPNDPDRCKDIIPFSKLDDHRHRCNYVLMECPFSEYCLVEAAIRKDILSHVAETHNFKVVEGAQTTISVSSDVENQPFGFIFNVFEAVFVVSYEKTKSIMGKTLIAFTFQPKKVEVNDETYEVRIKPPSKGIETKKFPLDRNSLYFIIKANSIFTITIVKTF